MAKTKYKATGERIRNKSTGRKPEVDAKYDAKRKPQAAARNKNRREAIKAGLVKRGDGKQIDHIKPMGGAGKGVGNNSKSNLRVVSQKTNMNKEVASKKSKAKSPAKKPAKKKTVRKRV